MVAGQTILRVARCRAGRKGQWTIRVERSDAQVEGSGYHDHNWGNVSPAALFDGLVVGQGQTANHTVIARFCKSSALSAVTKSRSCHRDQKLVEVSSGRQPEATAGPAAPTLIQSISGPSARMFPLARQMGAKSGQYLDRVLTSVDLLARFGHLKRLTARAMGLKPWYTRFESSMTTRLVTAASAGSGTLEFFELQ